VTGEDLIMQLTMEQGPGRETQVQPPLGVWVSYFNIDLDHPPTLRLINKCRRNPRGENRPVVEHDHNWTVEVMGANVPRPAIIRFHRTGKNRYEYWVYLPADPEYRSCDWILATFRNPRRSRGRRWIVI
jgi:hypothetical protein